MQRKMMCLLVMVACVLFGTMQAIGYENTYPYKNVCPKGPDGNPGDSIEGGYWNSVKDDKGNEIPEKSYYVDKWGFAQCNCTSYVAWKLNERGIPLKNGFSGGSWSNGSHWDDAVNDQLNGKYDEYNVYVTTDNPQVGDVAFWNKLGGDNGHVANVEKVNFENEKIVSVEITEYNYRLNKFGTDLSDYRTIPVDNPDGYIHFTKREVIYWRIVGNVGWAPANKSCAQADKWIFIKGPPDYNYSAVEDASRLICEQEEYNMMMSLGGAFSNWWEIIYGFKDLGRSDECIAPK